VEITVRVREITRRKFLIIGFTLLIIGILLFLLQPLGFIIVLYPTWFLFDLNYPIITIPYLLFYGGVIIILYTALEGDREHSWKELLPYLFLLGVLLKDHFVLFSHGINPDPSLFGVGVFIFLDGFLVFTLAFLLPRLMDGALSRSVIYWIYLFFGVLIMMSSNS
jgi:hypothetical protein